MMKKDSRVSRLLGTEYPVIQAAMNWLTSAELAAAVSNAGGCGLLGPNAGQSRLTADIQETCDRMRDEVRRTAAMTDKPFGMQIIDPMANSPYTPGFLEVAITEPGLKLVLVNGQMSKENIDKLHAAGKVVFRKMISDDIATFKESEALGYDAVVATGVDCGGHTNDKCRIGTMTMIPIACEAVSIPVIAAGGMIDAKTVSAAGVLGAEGIYCGTRFVVCEEGPCARNVKELLCKTTTDDLVELNGIWGPIRSIKTPVALKCHELTEESHKNNKMEINQLYSPGYKVSMLEGDVEACVVDCGAAIGQIKEILTCQQIMDEYARGME